MQAIGLQLVGERRGQAEQGYRPNLPSFGRTPGNGMNHGLMARGPGELDRVEVVAFGGEAEVLRGVFLSLGVLEGSCRDLGWPFSVGGPGSGSVDGIAIDLEPTADIEQYVLHLVGDGAIGTGTDVHQQVAIFAHDVHQLMNDEFRCFEGVVLDVAPGLVADRSVGLPDPVELLVELAAFY